MVDIKKLYADIQKVMKHKEPFCDPEFSLIRLSQMMESNTTYVSRAINAGAGTSFPNWLAEYRINKALKIMEKNPEISTHELCRQIGEKNSVVMRRQFYRITGKLFSER